MSKNIPNGAKPFDLQKALAGEKVIIRDGKEVKYLQVNWGVSGRFLGMPDSSLDLFMAPKTKTVWVNLYMKDSEAFRIGNSRNNSEESAKQWICESYDETYLKTMSVEIPDEDS